MHGIIFSAKNDSERFHLPVNPEKVNVKIEGDGETFKIAKLGSVNIPKDVELKEFSLESFFPSQEYHFLETDFFEPSYYIEKLENWMEKKEPIRYIYVNGSFTINELVTIESFQYDESFGSEDVNFSLSLKKFVPFAPKKVIIVSKTVANKDVAVAQVTAVKNQVPPRQNQPPIPKTYSLITGDSLWKVAQKYTGNGNNYRELQQLNGISDSQLRKLPVGLKLKIPPAWEKK
ncbi:LysM peptidoglycan-binding domain-containing protein [Schinkia azotoformans]|uniref:Peptidoglycan-binding LysM n=1 Tax=Schinkia azotoformans LMG 9581 TaxID=1131731 RepID=K6C8T4_SCHAZ|nr:LysM peptidoglycan-binding domain-containing protein [Schinkia azotoformans]EKN67500.1 peptidoglycan-binding LysM [Schinkia azotoformans LMG 9581]MEC1637340.1 LysM peptidoglycan-binding domain-containing protein [Schinkia azotoformans]MEC1943744.1 LysM peptidoglycan-binding domain-containing protein [Schinkia azotoformans]